MPLPPFSPNHFVAYAHVMRCTGDHARCGCSPERIASRTCCCCQSKRLGLFRSASCSSKNDSEEARPVAPAASAPIGAEYDCCNKVVVPGRPSARNASLETALAPPEKPGCCNKNPNRDEKYGKDGHNRLIPCIGAMPCCDDPASITVSLEKLKFLRPAILRFVPAALSVEYPLLPRIAYQGRIPEPPDPPPRLFILS